MQTKIRQVAKPWAIYCLANGGIGPRELLERFTNRADAETYFFKVRKSLPKSMDLQLVCDIPMTSM